MHDLIVHKLRTSLMVQAENPHDLMTFARSASLFGIPHHCHGTKGSAT